MSAAIQPLMQNLGARVRQQVLHFRSRFTSAEKAEKPHSTGNVLRTSLSMHRPVWVAAGTGVYTSAAAVLIAMRCFRHVR